MTQNDKAFAGAIPQVYETHLVPLIFEPYAADLARRLSTVKPARILEIAAGTGVVTRALATALPDASIVATDLNQAMLDQAAATGTPPNVRWRTADAQQLPFEDASFDAVVCQFGVMFFPDKARAHAEAHRVLKSGGRYVFNVWDRLEDNVFAETVTQVLAQRYPKDPPRFLARTPYGYCDPQQIRRDLAVSGFQPPLIDTVTVTSRAASARIPALAFCLGSPLRGEIESRDAGALDAATDAAARALTKRFGAGAVEGKIQALVVSLQA